MCGRTSCTLDPEHICKAMTYRPNNSNIYTLPEWKQVDGKQHIFTPSANIAPSEVLPAMISGHQIEATTERVIVPMIWGMIPPWHKGDFRTHGLTTHNIRDDNLFLSKLYLPIFKRCLRCVVLCDGFYEWKKVTERGNYKQPYFIYMQQPEGLCISDGTTWNLEWSEEEGWKGPRLVPLAGLYNVWVSPEGEKVYSCSVFTTAPNEDLQFIHHRCPVVLETEEAIQMWLDVQGKSAIDAVALLKSPEMLVYHPVSNIVNNAKHKDEDCTKPIELDRPRIGSNATAMEAWLLKHYGHLKKRPEQTEVKKNEEVKRIKLEEEKKQEQKKEQAEKMDIDSCICVKQENTEKDDDEDEEEDDDDDDDEDDGDEGGGNEFVDVGVVDGERADGQSEETSEEKSNDEDDVDEDDDEIIDDDNNEDDNDEEEEEEEDDEDETEEDEEEENSIKLGPDSDGIGSSGDDERMDATRSRILSTSADLCNESSLLDTPNGPPSTTTDLCTDESDVVDTQNGPPSTTDLFTDESDVLDNQNGPPSTTDLCTVQTDVMNTQNSPPSTKMDFCTEKSDLLDTQLRILSTSADLCKESSLLDTPNGPLSRTTNLCTERSDMLDTHNRPPSRTMDVCTDESNVLDAQNGTSSTTMELCTDESAVVNTRNSPPSTKMDLCTEKSDVLDTQ